VSIIEFQLHPQQLLANKTALHDQGKKKGDITAWDLETSGRESLVPLCGSVLVFLIARQDTRPRLTTTMFL
jgi:hypothetical protein